MSRMVKGRGPKTPSALCLHNVLMMTKSLVAMKTSIDWNPEGEILSQFVTSSSFTQIVLARPQHPGIMKFRKSAALQWSLCVRETHRH